MYSSIVDEDECEDGNGGCSQICNNLPGNYQCDCEDGYELQDDGTTCEEVHCR